MGLDLGVYGTGSTQRTRGRAGQHQQDRDQGMTGRLGRTSRRGRQAPREDGEAGPSGTRRTGPRNKAGTARLLTTRSSCRPRCGLRARQSEAWGDRLESEERRGREGGRQRPARLRSSLRRAERRKWKNWARRAPRGGKPSGRESTARRGVLRSSAPRRSEVSRERGRAPGPPRDHRRVTPAAHSDLLKSLPEVVARPSEMPG